MAVTFSLDSKDLAEKYEDICTYQLSDGRILIARMEVKPGDSVLDIGCGTGRLGRYVINIIGSTGHFIGIDPLEDRIKIANENNQSPNAVFRVGVAEDVGFIPDSSIDIVYLNWVFNWVLDKDIVLAEIMRVLKPGGKVGFVMTDRVLTRLYGGNAISEKVLSREPYKSAVNLQNGVHNLHGLTASELIDYLVRAGFMVEDVQVKLAKKVFQSEQHAMQYFEASYFGNYLNHVPDSLRDQAKNDVFDELKSYRTKDGVEFHMYVLSAIAKKTEL
jgi:ubiquinone/menaquinone biosynthesis C-methylase UbiE